MEFESQWPGDAIAAPFCPAYDREDAFFESLDGRSWARFDKRSEQLDTAPTAVLPQDWPDTAINPALPSSAPSSWRLLQLPGVNTETAPRDFGGWRAWVIASVSSVVELWSRMLREREIRRTRAAWERVDDRTLKDIGITRYEIEYGRDVRHRS